MAAVQTVEQKLQYKFELQRGQSTATRSLTVSDVPEFSASYASTAENFLQIFTGGTTNPFSVIDPTTFFQPTGWRDNDPDEDPWTTVGGEVHHVTTTDYLIAQSGETPDTPSGGLSASTLRIVAATNNNVSVISNSSQTPTLMFDNDDNIYYDVTLAGGVSTDGEYRWLGNTSALAFIEEPDTLAGETGHLTVVQPDDPNNEIAAGFATMNYTVPST